ncbi:MAG: hypothetical protein KF894_07060 [Labilithrix sp.]|nr:hypothetical protein [Labilithrix sp.]
MKSELLARSPLLILPLGALFLFLVVFLTVLFVTMKRRAPAYDPVARLPFEDDERESGEPS